MILKDSIDRYYILFLAGIFLILIAGLGSYGLAETSEARYAEISREMLMNGDYLNPELLGIFHFHKPPITYYITTLGYRIFGINEFGARFFLQVALVLQFLLVYRFTNLLYNDKRIGFMAGVLFFSIPIVLISCRNLTTDAFLATFILASIYFWQAYSSKGKILFLYLFYLMVGLALLTKGPVALLFVLVYIIIDKIVFKKRSNFSIHHFIGLVICTSIGASWYVLVMIENPKLWEYFIQKQLISRVNSNSFNRAKPFWYYLPIVFGLLLPWWLAMIPNLKSHLKSLSDKPPQSKVLIYSSLLLLIIFSAFSTKLIMYILPIFSMLAMLAAVEIYNAQPITRTILNISYGALFFLLLAGIMVLKFGSFEWYVISKHSLFLSALLLVLFLATYYFIDKTKNYKPVALAGILGIATVLISTSFMAQNSWLTNSPREMIHFIQNKSSDKEKTILVYDYLLASIPFYSDGEYITLKYKHYTSNREVQFENDDTYKDYLWDLKKEESVERLNTLSQMDNTFLLVLNRRDLAENLSFLKDNFNSQKEYPKWTIYYND